MYEKSQVKRARFLPPIQLHDVAPRYAEYVEGKESLVRSAF